VAERVEANKEPAILAVLPTRSLLDLKRQAAGIGRLALLPQLLYVFRMKHSGTKLRTDHVLHGQAGIFQHCLIRVERIAARVQDDNGLRDSVRNPAKLPPV